MQQMASGAHCFCPLEDLVGHKSPNLHWAELILVALLLFLAVPGPCWLALGFAFASGSPHLDGTSPWDESKWGAKSQGDPPSNLASSSRALWGGWAGRLQAAAGSTSVTT